VLQSMAGHHLLRTWSFKGGGGGTPHLHPDQIDSTQRVEVLSHEWMVAMHTAS
jgi:hypothetical protein